MQLLKPIHNISKLMGTALLFSIYSQNVSAANIQIGSGSKPIETRLTGAEKKLDILKLKFRSLSSTKRLDSEQQHSIVLAQSSVGELQLRLNTVEQQLRMMTGQLEQLQYQMQQMLSLIHI